MFVATCTIPFYWLWEGRKSLLLRPACKHFLVINISLLVEKIKTDRALSICKLAVVFIRLPDHIQSCNLSAALNMKPVTKSFNILPIIQIKSEPGLNHLKLISDAANTIKCNEMKHGYSS